MRRIITCLVVALVPLWAANAQPLKPNTPSILQWTPEQQREGYRSIETIYKTATIARGEAVRALGNADRTLELSYTRDGRNWTIDDFMKAFNVSGLMVLKDGKVLVEHYGLGRQPQDRWTSFSIAKSVTSTLVGAAIQDGKIKSLDDPGDALHPRAQGLGLRRRQPPPDAYDELGREVERGLQRSQRRRRARRDDLQRARRQSRS